MSDNNSTNKNRNVTGSYPGVTGSYKPASSRPVNKQSVTGDTIISDTISKNIADALGGDTVVSQPVKPIKKEQAFEETMISDPVKVSDEQRKSRKENKPKPEPSAKSENKSFDWKMWFSGDNVKGFMKHLRFYGICSIIALLFTIGIVSVSNDVFAFIKPDETVIVNIVQGGSTESIAKSLKTAGVIKHPTVFRLYCKLKKAEGKFQYGDYSLNSNMDYDKIISKLKKTSVQAETVKLTIPVGATQDEITEILTAGKYVNITELEHALNSYEYENFEFVQNLPERRCRLEGYLPAGEYEVAKGESAVSIISKMLTRFQETVLTEANIALIQKTGKTLDDIIITSSLVQAECNNAADYKKAASVLANRLSNPENNYLQLTCTINYTLPTKKSTLTVDDKLTDSSYNTYLYPGLPTGPVCTPTPAAVESVINPESTGYTFFVSDGEKTTFSTDPEQHKKALESASKTAKGTDVIR